MSTSKSPKRPMTPDELTAIGMLKGVTFAVASWDKRASAHLFSAATPPAPAKCHCNLTPDNTLFAVNVPQHDKDCPTLAPPWQPMISEKMAPQLWRILFRYRRQIRHPERVKFLRMAEKLMVPDYRTPTYRKAQEAKYKIEAMKREAAQKEAA